MNSKCAAPLCKCGGESVFVDNGPRLQYYYCRTCKEEVGLQYPPFDPGPSNLSPTFVNVPATTPRAGHSAPPPPVQVPANHSWHWPHPISPVRECLLCGVVESAPESLNPCQHPAAVWTPLSPLQINNELRAISEKAFIAATKASVDRIFKKMALDLATQYDPDVKQKEWD